jgi:hypothetical protein
MGAVYASGFDVATGEYISCFSLVSRVNGNFSINNIVSNKPLGIIFNGNILYIVNGNPATNITNITWTLDFKRIQ